MTKRFQDAAESIEIRVFLCLSLLCPFVVDVVLALSHWKNVFKAFTHFYSLATISLVRDTRTLTHTHTHLLIQSFLHAHTLTSIALILFHQLSLVATTRSHARTHTHKTLSLSTPQSTIPLSSTLPTYSVNQNDPRQEELNTLPAKGEDTHQQQQRATTANSWRTTPATTPGAPGFGRKKSWLPSKSSYRQNFGEGGGQMKTQSSRQQQKTNKPQFQFSPD